MAKKSRLTRVAVKIGSAIGREIVRLIRLLRRESSPRKNGGHLEQVRTERADRRAEARCLNRFSITCFEMSANSSWRAFPLNNLMSLTICPSYGGADFHSTRVSLLFLAIDPPVGTAFILQRHAVLPILPSFPSCFAGTEPCGLRDLFRGRLVILLEPRWPHDDRCARVRDRGAARLRRRVLQGAGGAPACGGGAGRPGKV